MDKELMEKHLFLQAVETMRERNPVRYVIAADCTDTEAEEKERQAQKEHPLQEISVIRVRHVSPV